MGYEQILLAKKMSLFSKRKPKMEDFDGFLRDHAAQINGSLCVFGDWFGRPMDNWHRLVSYEAKEGYVRLVFNEGETLEVWEPSGFRFDGKSFIIQSASRVRWEWFYYGRPQIPENRFFIDHFLTSDGVDAKSDVNWAPHNFKPSRAQSAVSIT
jgi:hypothetical protein